jgi:hypothetical protein
VSTDPYVNLIIDELAYNLDSNSSHVRGSFTQLPMAYNTNTYSKQTFRSIKRFKTPLAKLSRFTVKFTTSNGSLYAMRDHFLRFEIICASKMLASIDMSPEAILGVKNVHEFNVLKKAFLEKAKESRRNDPLMYNTYKNAFKDIAKRNFGM